MTKARAVEWMIFFLIIIGVFLVARQPPFRKAGGGGGFGGRSVSGGGSFGGGGVSGTWNEPNYSHRSYLVLYQQEKSQILSTKTKVVSLAEQAVYSSMDVLKDPNERARVRKSINDMRDEAIQSLDKTDAVLTSLKDYTDKVANDKNVLSRENTNLTRSKQTCLYGFLGSVLVNVIALYGLIMRTMNVFLDRRLKKLIIKEKIEQSKK
jgi:hypothetical protein